MYNEKNYYWNYDVRVCPFHFLPDDPCPECVKEERDYLEDVPNQDENWDKQVDD